MLERRVVKSSVKRPGKVCPQWGSPASFRLKSERCALGLQAGQGLFDASAPGAGPDLCSAKDQASKEQCVFAGMADRGVVSAMLFGLDLSLLWL